MQKPAYTSVTGRVHESASNARETIAEKFQPGDTKATSRRTSDTPDNIWQFGQGGPREERDYGLEREKSLLQSAQETVAKALGGGSRGYMKPITNELLHRIEFQVMFIHSL
ncbi:hypothetical protein PCH_Pc22g24470 [Penicillium rubens Wisconsin 54-1255]|uniref:Uncharacterized protein n=1 Tax=Penicillium rubens (strain ATCC 28089 / DSM 1075 / NRRL 1951 / Wisconsin 54-1255) TaxID=500485 RepID=B6HQV6_PENRW|nr:hypothetical protein PCH_Pc22g24470 [Penicillium rubens Wisconsin 54-1255]